jgi:hypothetical protein
MNSLAFCLNPLTVTVTLTATSTATSTLALTMALTLTGFELLSRCRSVLGLEGCRSPFDQSLLERTRP